MFGPVRRMERRRGLVVGMAIGAAAARPRTVVYGVPTYPVGYCAGPTVQVIATPQAPPPTTTQIIVNQSEEKYPLPPAPYSQVPPPAAAAYPQAPPPPYQQSPPYLQQPAYNPASVPQAPVYSPPATASVEVVKKPELPVRRTIERRYFLLINEANCQVLQVDHGTAHKGAKLVIDRRRPERVSIQRWYMDEQGCIRCALNDYALESKDGGDKIYTVSYCGDARQQWIMKDNRIVNRMLTSDCIGLKKRLFLSDDADVIVSRYDNKPYQHWRVEYV